MAKQEASFSVSIAAVLMIILLASVAWFGIAAATFYAFQLVFG